MLTTSRLTSQVEMLAKIYIESPPADVSAKTIAQLCDWLMEEFQQLPLNLQFSDYMRYRNAQEMFVDIKQDHLWVSADSYDSTIYPNPIYGFIFQGMHDYAHYLTGSDFSLEGEIIAYNFMAKRVPSLEIQKIVVIAQLTENKDLSGSKASKLNLTLTILDVFPY